MESESGNFSTRVRTIEAPFPPCPSNDRFVRGPGRPRRASLRPDSVRSRFEAGDGLIVPFEIKLQNMALAIIRHVRELRFLYRPINSWYLASAASQSFFCSNANASWSRRWLIRSMRSVSTAVVPEAPRPLRCRVHVRGGCLHRVTAGFKGKGERGFTRVLAVYKDLGTGGCCRNGRGSVRLLMASATCGRYDGQAAAMHRDFPPRCNPNEWSCRFPY